MERVERVERAEEATVAGRVAARVAVARAADSGVEMVDLGDLVGMREGVVPREAGRHTCQRAHSYSDSPRAPQSEPSGCRRGSHCMPGCNPP